MAAGSSGDLGPPVRARDLGHAALELVIARLAADGKSSRADGHPPGARWCSRSGMSSPRSGQDRLLIAAEAGQESP